VILLILIVYGRDLEILAIEALNSEVLSHVILMPFFIGYLLYRKRDVVKATLILDKLQKRFKAKYLDELVGLSLCLIALLLYWYGSYTFYPLEYHMLSLPIFIAGVTLILLHFKTLKALFLPILFLLFFVPFPNEIMYTWGGALANFNTQVSYVLLKTFGLPVTLSTSYGAPTINLGLIPFTIDLPCSGIYTLIAFVMFAVFLASIISAPPWKKITIFILGFIVFEVLNILRITIIILSAAFLGEEIAMQFFHTTTGLILIFVGMLLTLFISEKFLKIKFFSKIDKKPSCPKCKTAQKTLKNFCLNCGKFFNSFERTPSQTFWAKLIFLLLGCSILTLSINAPTFAITQEIKVASTWENTNNILPQIPQYDLRYGGRDLIYEQIAKQDAALTYYYIPFNISTPVVYVLVNVANTISNLHSWEFCLISLQTAKGQSPLVSVLDSRDIQLLEGFPIIARYLVFRDAENYTQVTLYWFERAVFRTGGTVQQKYVRISLIILTRNSADYEEYENHLLNFGQAIAQHWEPIKIQSLISLGVPAQQALLVFLVVFIIVAEATQYVNERRKRANNLKIFNNFASSYDKLLLQTITELSKERKMTTRDINIAIKNKVGKFMKLERLVEKLNSLMEYGFIKMDITSNDNKPSLVWKSLVNI
jgi:exosortase